MVYVINAVIAVLIGLIFILLGIRQCKSDVPVVMNTGEKPLKPEQLSDVEAWNKGHGRALILYGVAVSLTVGTFPIVLDFFHTDVVISTVVYVVVFVLEIVGLAVNHGRLEQRYRK